MSVTNSTTAFALAVSCAVVVYIASAYPKDRKRSHPLPPGPPALPIVGNIRGINVNAPWETYVEWGTKYGDLIYAHFFDQEIIIINSEKVAKDLLEDRSSNYSDRPSLMTNTLFGFDYNTTFRAYGERWRRQRRLFHQTFKLGAASRFRLMQEEKARQLLHNLLASPEHWSDHLFLYTSSLILKAVYDYDAIHRDDHVVITIEKAISLLVKVLVPEVAAILNAFPMLLHFPLWLPSFTIKRDAALSRKLLKVVELPFKNAQQRLDDGSTTPTMVFDGLRNVIGDGKDSSTGVIQDLKDASATAFTAAAETSYSFLTSFMLAMVLFPNVQAKAQAEIDSLCGRDRLPTLDDRPSLTYLEAIIRETLRWAPVLPLSIPHRAVDGDVYNGHYIPKGATIIPNLWSDFTTTIPFLCMTVSCICCRAMSRNEERYPKPSEFIPERFLDSSGNLTDDNVADIAFGHGRRICVGRHFADSSLWIAVSMILAVFKLSPPKNKDGSEVPIEVKWSAGMTRHPLPFPISISPRINDLGVEKLDGMISAGA